MQIAGDRSRLQRGRWLVAGLAVAVLAAAAVGAWWIGRASPAGGIQVESAWARAATRPPGQAGGTSAAYMVIRNAGSEDDRLVGARSDASAITEVHESYLDGGVMRMRRIDSVAVPAGGTIRLEPGGLHVMLIDLRDDLREGVRFNVTLRFERAGEVPVVVEVRAADMPARH